MQDIQSLLKHRLKQNGIERPVLTAQVLDKANQTIEEVFGEGSTENCARAISLKYGVLRIGCMAAVYQQEINLRQSAIIRMINSHFDKDWVKRIQLII